MDESRCSCIDAFKKGNDVHRRYHRRQSTRLKRASPRDLPSGCSKHEIGFAIVGIEIYSDTSREGTDATCAIVWPGVTARQGLHLDFICMRKHLEGNAAS
jgi:hypothetical protein